MCSKDIQVLPQLTTSFLQVPCCAFRLSEQAQKQFLSGPTKFEDISVGAVRPTELIRSFGNLYTEARVEAFDALDEVPQMAGFDDLKGKLLFSIVVVSHFLRMYANLNLS